MSFMSHRGFYQGATSLTRADRHLNRQELETVAPSVYAEAAHDSRSGRYGYVNSRDIVRALWEEGFAPFSVQQARVRQEDRHGFQKHLIKFRRRDEAVTPAEARRIGDTRAEVVLVNSHDGTSSLQAYGGIFRLVCLNGMVIGEQVEAIKVSHTVNAVRGAVEAVVTMAAHTVDVFDTIDTMKARALTRDERFAFAETALALRYGPDSPIDAARALTPVRRDDTGADLWTTLNVVQEHVLRGGDRAWVRGSNGRLRRQTTREVTGIDQSVGLNRQLWNAATALLAA